MLVEYQQTMAGAGASPSDTEPNSTRASLYHRSRLFGQTHRRNKESEERGLAGEIVKLRRDHDMLKSLIKQNAYATDWRTAPVTAYQPVNLECGRKYSLLRKSAEVIGTTTLSPFVAIALFEIIALRRNVIGPPRNRGNDLTATTPELLSSVVDAVASACSAEFSGDWLDAHLYAVQQLRVLGDAHKNWANYEANKVITDEEEDDLKISRQTRPRARAKRCTRCKKLRSAGSGHGRSTCDDGVRVSSNVPYPAPHSYSRNDARSSGKHP